MKGNIKDYDPKTGFGHFASIMNANAAIDTNQNKKNAVSLPLVNDKKSVGGVK